MKLLILVALALGTGDAAWAARYRIIEGDHLWGLAGKFYDNHFCWPVLHEANKSSIKNPHWIYPNQELEVPDSEKCRPRENPPGVSAVAPVAPAPEPIESSAAVVVEMPPPAPPDPPPPPPLPAAPREETLAPPPAVAPGAAAPGERMPDKMESGDLSADIPPAQTTYGVGVPRLHFPKGWTADGRVTSEGLVSVGGEHDGILTTKRRQAPGTRVIVYRPTSRFESEEGQTGVFLQKVGVTEILRRIAGSRYRFRLLSSGDAVQESDWLKVEP